MNDMKIETYTPFIPRSNSFDNRRGGVALRRAERRAGLCARVGGWLPHIWATARSAVAALPRDLVQPPQRRLCPQTKGVWMPQLTAQRARHHATLSQRATRQRQTD